MPYQPSDQSASEPSHPGASGALKPAATATARVRSTATTMIRVSWAVRVTPNQLTVTRATTAMIATGFSHPAGAAYAAKVSAIAAQLAVFPTTKPHPAMKPHHGPSSALPYAYVPPDVGCTAASCADDVALPNATTAARARPMSRPEPAALAAGPKAAKTPAPIIEPRPMKTASARPSLRTSPGELTSSTLAPGRERPMSHIPNPGEGDGVMRRTAS